MKKTVLVFGLLSGAVSSVMMFATLPFIDSIGFHKQEYIGYTTIVLSFLLVFFGVRSYRENQLGGSISFGRAFGAGILITLISCALYVISWEIIYFFITPDFIQKYGEATMANMKASGATPEMLAKAAAEMKDFAVMYDNPFINAAITFIEPFPIGLIITLVSAAILRRKKTNTTANA